MVLFSTINNCLTTIYEINNSDATVTQEVERLSGNWKVAGSIPGYAELSVEVSLSKTPKPNCS